MTPGIIICPSCGMRLLIRPGRPLTAEERAASAWRPQHGPCSRPFITVEDFVERAR